MVKVERMMVVTRIQGDTSKVRGGRFLMLYTMHNGVCGRGNKAASAE